jgi:methionine synthase II (cobalamin-independent)
VTVWVGAPDEDKIYDFTDAYEDVIQSLKSAGLIIDVDEEAEARSASAKPAVSSASFEVPDDWEPPHRPSIDAGV